MHGDWAFLFLVWAYVLTRSSIKFVLSDLTCWPPQLILHKLDLNCLHLIPTQHHHRWLIIIASHDIYGMQDHCCLHWNCKLYQFIPWWRHQMETFSAPLAICAGNSPVPGEFPTQRPVTRSFDVYFDLRPNKRLSKQSWGWWFDTLSCSLWRHCNATWEELTTWNLLTHLCVTCLCINGQSWHWGWGLLQRT